MNTADRVKKIIVEHLACDPEKVLPDASFIDLGADGLDLIELTIAFEEVFDLRLGDEELDHVETVGEVTRIIEAKMPAATAGAQP